MEAAALDRGRHGGGTFGSNDHQPYRRCSLRQGQSPYKSPRLSDRCSVYFLCMGIHRDCGRGIFPFGLASESPGAEASPVALAILFFYSFTKRFTSWSHVVLGFALGISPAAAWIAITGSLDWRMLILCAAVTLWVGGFDVLYACQDVEFDRQAGLFSVPRRFGIAASLQIARAMHVGVVLLLSWLAASFGLPGRPGWA